MGKTVIFFICEFRVESCEVLVKGAAELNLVSDIKRETGVAYDEDT